MKALDLRLRPPRAPREELDGLMFMPRTIDKICATLPGGHLGPYHVTPGMSQMLLDTIGIELAELRRAVMLAKNDLEIAAWLRERADTAKYARANEFLSTWRHEHIAAEHRAHFESHYPGYLRARYAVGFDLIEADDRELYPALDAHASAL